LPQDHRIKSASITNPGVVVEHGYKGVHIGSQFWVIAFGRAKELKTLNNKL